MKKKLFNTSIDSGLFIFICIVFFLTILAAIYYKVVGITVDILYFAFEIFKIFVIFGFSLLIYKISTYHLNKSIKKKKEDLLQNQTINVLNIFEKSAEKITKLGPYIEFGLFFSLILSNKRIIGKGGLLYNLLFYTYNVIIFSLVLFLILLSYESIIMFCVE